MSISSIFGSPIRLAPKSLTTPSLKSFNSGIEIISISTGCGYGGLSLECSSRPKKKATAHHMKTRPRKSQPWDIRRKPTVYAPLPPLPPDWTLVSSTGDESGDSGVGNAPEAASPSNHALQAPDARSGY